MFDRWEIQRSLVRIILFRVMPGHEVSVGRQIEQSCRRFGLPPESFKVFRLFGSYDLAFIQDGSKLLESEFVRLGTIPGITASTEYVCYTWKPLGRRSKPVFSIRQLSDPLLGLCFLKINPIVVEKLGLNAELLLAESIRGGDGAVQMLGTMGWFEVVLVISDSSLSGILDRIGQQFPRMRIQQGPKKSEVFAEKTFTMLGHALDVSDPAVRRPPVVSIADELQNDNLEVHFSASCTPGAMTQLQSAARSHFGLDQDKTGGQRRITVRLGARDLDFSVRLRGVKTLNQLLKQLDEFRRANAKDLIRTHTELQYRVDKSRNWELLKPLSMRKTIVLALSKTQAKHLAALGPEGASAATAIYQFNNLLENRLLVDAFLDMVRAMTRLKTEAINHKPSLSSAARLRFATLLQYCHLAVSQRYQGAYHGVEESPWGVSFGVQPVGMGMQRMLKALEQLVADLVRKLGKEWGGFVLVGRHRSPTMEHFEDILLVPPNDALDVRRHWTMSHEVMHVMQFLSPERFSLKVFGDHWRNTTPTGKLLSECITDVMEFELSCILSVEDYLKLVWQYLADGIGELTEREQLESYLIRSFSVFYLAKCPPSWSPREEHARQMFFQRFVPIVSAAAPVVQRLKQEDARGQQPLELIFQEFLHCVFPKLRLIQTQVRSVRAKLKKPSAVTLNRAVRRIRNGQIVRLKDLSHPDAIAWQLARRPNDEKRDVSMESVVWLLSLWHKYQVAGGAPRLSATT